MAHTRAPSPTVQGQSPKERGDERARGGSQQKSQVIFVTETPGTNEQRSGPVQPALVRPRPAVPGPGVKRQWTRCASIREAPAGSHPTGHRQRHTTWPGKHLERRQPHRVSVSAPPRCDGKGWAHAQRAGSQTRAEVTGKGDRRPHPAMPHEAMSWEESFTLPM